MGIFSDSSPFDHDIEKATDEKNMGDNWETILDVCDKVKAITTGPKDCLRAIIKRLYHQNPHVAKQAVILLDACVSNCNKPFHLEIASRDSEQELYKLIKNKLHPQVASQLKQCLKKWAEGDFKTDSQLSLIPALYNRLRQEGADFTGSSEPVKKTVVPNKDVVAREEEDIAKAIALSLKEAEVTTKVSSSLYPSMTSAPISPVKDRERRKVRALYDFEAAEDNELTFNAGEIIHVIDDSDPNWWKGSNQRGEGLFPANFVSTDLDAEPEVMVTRETSKRVQFNEQVVVATLEETASSEAEVEIDEAKIDRMLHALHEADPTGERNDPDELKMLEDQCGAMAPLIDAELEKLDRRHAHLTKLGSHLIESLDMYRSLMREMPGHSHTHPNINMVGMPVPVYQYPGATVASTVSVGGMNVAENMKYSFPQPQAPPQSPSLAPFAPLVNHSATFSPNQAPNPMPYGVSMGQQHFGNPYSSHPPNF